MHSVTQEEKAPAVSDSRRELTALFSGCGIFRPDDALFSITGRDRVRWLNGMVTNNIRDLSPARGVYSFVLNAQGHILGDLYVFNRGESLVANVERQQAESLLQVLRRYIIMDKVEIEGLSGKMAVLGVAGPKSVEVLASAGIAVNIEPLQTADVNWNGMSATLVRGDNPGFANFEMWVPIAQAEAVWDSLLQAGAEPAGEDTLETFRILCGIPKIGQDIRERTLPQETGQERALNYSKGCYIGQEIVERIRARGSVHRTFTGFEVEGSLPAPGTKIQSGGKDVGEITSVMSSPLKHKRLARGYLRKEVLSADSVLSAGEAVVKPRSLPFTDIFN